MTLTSHFSRVRVAGKLGDVILVNEHGEAFTWGGSTTTPIYDFTLNDIARFDTEKEAEEFASSFPEAMFWTIGEIPEEFREGGNGPVELTSKQQDEAFNAVNSAYDNIGSIDYTSEDDYATALSSIEGSIFERGREESRKVLKAIYDLAVQHLDADFRRSF